MLKNQDKKGTIYSAMCHYRTKFLIITVLLLVAFLIYFGFSYKYISNIFATPEKLDAAVFSKTVPQREVGEEYELHRRDEISIPEFALKGESYWQGNVYEFDVEIDDAQKTSIVFNNRTTGTGSEENAEEISAHLYVADIGGVETLVLTYPHIDLASLDSIEGIFTTVPNIVNYEIAKSGYFDSDDMICKYMLDTRGLEMESEAFDLVFSLILFVLLVYLITKLILQYKNYLCTPTYRQLEKYDYPSDVERKIEKELEGKSFYKGSCETENWILKKDTFKLKIVKNHRQHGKFEYIHKQ